MSERHTRHHPAHHSEPSWVHGHAHEPNPAPPSSDPAFTLQLPNGRTAEWSVAALLALPSITVADCYIVSTGHDSSGPFAFTGVSLQTFLAQSLPSLHWPNVDWHSVDVVSADGFGTRLRRADLTAESAQRPTLLAHTLDGQALTRAQGLVRLIVPTETDDALRQVKWVAQIVLYADAP